MSEEHSFFEATVRKISDDQWNKARDEFIASMRSTPLSFNTEAWNAFTTALPKFRSILEKALQGETS